MNPLGTVGMLMRLFAMLPGQSMLISLTFIRYEIERYPIDLHVNSQILLE